MNLVNELTKKEPLEKEEREKMILDATKQIVSADSESKNFIAGFLTGIQLKDKNQKPEEK